jgi:hypothetical protein
MTSMMKRCLHTNLWPLVKNSSQWIHLSSLQRWTISVGERRMVPDGGLFIDAGAEGAGLKAVVEVAGRAMA